MSKAFQALLLLNTFWLASFAQAQQGEQQLDCTTSPINADQQSVLDPSNYPPGYYDFLFKENEAQFYQLLDSYLEENPQVQVVELLKKLKIVKVSPTCPGDSLSLPEGWEEYLQPVTEVSYGIIGGQQAPEGRFPYVVSLRDNKNGDHFCGGTLIRPDVILTAAHCFFRGGGGDRGDSSSSSSASSRAVNPTAAVGRFLRNADTKGSTVLQVIETVLHPEFKFGRNFTHDVALLKLSAPVGFPTVSLNYDPNADFLNLSNQENNRDTTSNGKNATILGWGITEQGLAQALRQGTIPLVSREECAQVEAFSRAGAPITSTMLCAGQVPKRIGQIWPHLPPVDACQGDSGGPLLSVSSSPPDGADSSGDVQYGIISFGVGCAKPGVPGVYTDISKVKDFIEETLKKFDG
ncbi:putative Mite allergen Eur m 3 [Nannochloris sp. 'desiccata']|nr:hypothetical protein KSW81_003395 [Chlorella desiccata (nom. nud.)]KAH7622973.1 putative Mite allergen Eur m 3 [Chlorella desiccata (nom. nud.)]